MKEATSYRILADSQINESCWPLISNLVSLVRHIETSITFCASAKDAHGQEEAADNIAVLDDVTPRYAMASDALVACKMQLREALHVLLNADNRLSCFNVTTQGVAFNANGSTR
jgi:hypothetical protein